MKKDKRISYMFIRDIQIAVKRILQYVEGYDFEKFKQDYKTSDAVIRNLEIIREASVNVDDQMKANYPAVPWQEMYNLRKSITHHYYGVDFARMWEIVTTWMPQVKVSVDRLMENENI